MPGYLPQQLIAVAGRTLPQALAAVSGRAYAAKDYDPFDCFCLENRNSIPYLLMSE
jgi:hypothetical protein